MEQLPTISVIIPTLGRPQLVVRTIRALALQSHLPSQVIVVEQGEASPGLPLALESWGAAGVALRDEGFGASRARNLGLAHARGDILLFLDDDVIIDDSDFLASHAKCYASPEIGAVCGRTIEQRKQPSGRSPRLVPGIAMPFCICYGSTVATKRMYCTNVKGANGSFRRDAVRKSGGFDPTFGSPCMYEDTDLALRIQKLGYKILFEPGACLTHIGASRGGQRANPTGDAKVRSCRFLAYRDRVLLFEKHAPHMALPLFILANLLSGLSPLFVGKVRPCTEALAGLAMGLRTYMHTGQQRDNLLPYRGWVRNAFLRNSGVPCGSKPLRMRTVQCPGLNVGSRRVSVRGLFSGDTEPGDGER